jgi:hypothetical protein
MLPYNALLEREAREFFETLYILDAEQKIEVRWKPCGENGATMFREFYGNALEALQVVLNLRDKNDVYVGAAPRRGRVGTRDGVSELIAVWADLDAKGIHTRESRFKQLIDLPYHPSMMVWSGGGWHAYWLLKEPLQGQENLNRAEAVMKRLGKGLDGDAVHDLPRILRVPGTLNHKYGEPSPVRLVHHDPDKRYTLDQLQEMAEGFPKTDKPSSGSKVPRDVLNAPIQDGRRNVVLASVAGSLRDRGLDEETIDVVLLEVNRLRCEPPLPGREVGQIAKSVSRYASGSPRYRKSSATRIYQNGKVSR